MNRSVVYCLFLFSCLLIACVSAQPVPPSGSPTIVASCSNGIRINQTDSSITQGARASTACKATQPQDINKHQTDRE